MILLPVRIAAFTHRCGGYFKDLLSGQRSSYVTATGYHLKFFIPGYLRRLANAHFIPPDLITNAFNSTIFPSRKRHTSQYE
jgi:hypothetical protein